MRAGSARSKFGNGKVVRVADGEIIVFETQEPNEGILVVKASFVAGNGQAPVPHTHNEGFKREVSTQIQLLEIALAFV